MQQNESVVKNLILIVCIIGCISITLHPEWRALVAASYDSFGTQSLKEAGEKQEDAIEKRLEKLREESKKIKKQSANGDKTEAEILKENRWGLFITGTYGKIRRDTTQREIGYNADLLGFTAGADYRINTDLLLGGAFGYFDVDSNFDNNFGTSEATPISFSMYTEYVPMDNAFLNLTLGYTETEVDYKRNLPGRNGIINQANSVYDAHAFNAAFNSGYDWYFGSFSIGPRVGLNFAHIYNDDLIETTGGSQAVIVEGEVNDALSTSLGIQASHALSLPWGVLRTEIGGYYVHEFLDDSQTLQITNRVSGARSSFTTDDPDRDVFVGRAGIIFSVPRGLDFFVHYEGLYGHSYLKSHLINFGARVGF